MELILRAGLIYFRLLLVVRLAGKRTLAQATVFDFLLLLVIGDTVQQALIRTDESITGAMLVVTSLIALSVGLSIVKQRFTSVEKILEDVPTILVEDGAVLQAKLDRHRVGVSDVMEAARLTKGIAGLDQIRFAILERTGEISIIERQR
jgi:uncharacterized membrane protein YcaP (DUF421 family)